jgi:hypothetical protein
MLKVSWTQKAEKKSRRRGKAVVDRQMVYNSRSAPSKAPQLPSSSRSLEKSTTIGSAPVDRCGPPSTQRLPEDIVPVTYPGDDVPYATGATVWLPYPQTAISSFRRDSLSAYPLDLDHDGHFLVDFWLVNFPKMIRLNLSPDIESIYSPTRKVFFPLAMSSPAAFETTVLHFAALHRAKMRGVGVECDPYAISHRNRSLRMTQRRVESAIAGHSIPTDDDIVAVLSLATAECCVGDQSAAAVHLQGIRQLIRTRREHGQIPNNHKLELLFSWYNINTPISSHESAKTSPRVYTELQDDFDNFIVMLNNFRDLALLQHSTQISHIAPRLFSKARLIPGLCKILLCPPPDSPFYNHFPFQMCRFLIIMHVHMALFFFRNSVEQAELYLKCLTILTIGMDLESRTNPVFLLAWTIVSDPALHNSLRYWFTNRIAVIFKLLGSSTRHRISDFLLALLQLDEDENGELILPKFDYGVLEREVMHFEATRPATDLSPDTVPIFPL